MKKFWLPLLALFVAVIFILLLSEQKLGRVSTTTDNTLRIKVAASFMPIADMVGNIGGDKIEVIQILTNGASPHTYEPQPEDMQKLNGVSLAFVIGHGFDNWANTMLTDTAPGFQLITLDKGIPLRPASEANPQEYDPHYWLSLDNAKIMCQQIKLILTALDPTNKEYYQNNLNIYLAQIDTLKKSSQQELKLVKNKRFITFHTSFNYFAADLGLEVVTSIEEYPGKEPTPQYLANVGKIIQQYNIKTLFKDPEMSDTIVSSLANDYGAKVGTLDPAGSINNTYLEMMQYNISTLAKTL